MPRCAAAPGYLLPGRFSRGRSPVARPATSRGTVSMVVLEPQPQALRNESSQRDGNKVAVRQKKQATLTTPDLVLLSLLAERPMHGYEANLELERRRKFVEQELAREQETLRAILEEVGHPHHEAVWMVTLVIEQFRTELKWLGKLERELPRRAPAGYPAYAQGSPEKSGKSAAT